MFKHYYHQCDECGDTHTFVLEWPRMMIVGLIVGALIFFPLGITYQESKQRSQIIDEWNKEAS